MLGHVAAPPQIVGHVHTSLMENSVVDIEQYGGRTWIKPERARD